MNDLARLPKEELLPDDDGCLFLLPSFSPGKILPSPIARSADRYIAIASVPSPNPKNTKIPDMTRIHWSKNGLPLLGTIISSLQA